MTSDIMEHPTPEEMQDLNQVMQRVLQEAIDEVEATGGTVVQSDKTTRCDLDQLATELTIADGGWEAQISMRDYKEVCFAKTYAMQFRHGTAGHNRLMLIAHMAERLDMYEAAIKNCLRENKNNHETAVSNEV